MSAIRRGRGSLETLLGSKNRVKVLRVLYRRDGLSGRRVARMAGIPPSAGKAALEELVETGLVLRREGSGRNRYELDRTHHLYEAIDRLYSEEEQAVPRLMSGHDSERFLRFFGVPGPTPGPETPPATRDGDPRDGPTPRAEPIP
jgi:DNA-binding MarR family transcriptional regulator